jgi:hypothetical protein
LVLIAGAANAQNLTVTGTTIGQGPAYLATGGGNVGIGTTTPAFPLTIAKGGTAYGGVAPQLWVNGNNQTGGGIAISDDGGFFDLNDGWVTQVPFSGAQGLAAYGRVIISNTPGIFWAGWRHVVDGNAYVSGTQSVNYLQVFPQNSAGEGAEIHVTGSYGYSDWYFDVYQNRLRFFIPGAGERFSLNTNGHLWIAGTLNQNSTRSAKKDIHFLTAAELEQALSTLNQTPVATFRYKTADASSKVNWGVIAEETPAALLSDDGKSVNLSNTVGILMAAFKAQQARINEQQKLIDQLSAQQSKISQQARELEVLKAQVSRLLAERSH